MSKSKEEKKKKPKKQREPKYVKSALNTDVLNYREYYMSVTEKTGYFLISFVVGAIAAYLFYGGIGSDEAGNPTAVTHIINLIIMGGAGIGCTFLFVPMRSKQLKSKRKRIIRRQFMDLLDALSTSISSGNNAVKAFESAKNDLTMQYGEEAYIVKEVTLITDGIENMVAIEDLLEDFGKRSELKEIENFAQVFRLSYRKGGDFGKIIRDSYDILYNKIQVELEIETKVSATKNELNMMMCMPVLLVGMIKLTGGDFAANFHTATGIIATTVGITLIGGAYLIGRKITDIEV